MDQKQMLITFSIVSLVTMGIGFYNSFRRNCDDKEEGDELRSQEQQINKELENFNNLQALLASKAEEIQLKYCKDIPQVLTVDCLKEIFEFTAKIVDKEQLQLIYTNSRKARRSCFKSMRVSFGEGISPSLENYYRFVCTFEQQLQYLIQKSQKDFVVFLNIDYMTITDSIDHHTSDKDSDFADWVRNWTTQIKQQLREQLPLYKHPVSPAKILQIASYQVQVLISEGQKLKEAVQDLNLQSQDEHDAVPTFLELYLQDAVFQRFSLEIEQTNLAAEEVTVELREKFNILSELKSSVLEGMMTLLVEEEVASDYYDEQNRE